MKDNISPEEKLLKLIKGQKGKDNEVVSNSYIAAKKPESIAQRSDHIDGPIINFPKKINANKFIRLAIILSGSYLVFSVVYPLFGLKKIDTLQLPAEAKVESAVEEKDPRKPIEYYVDGIKDKKIFSGEFVQATNMPASGVNIEAIKEINVVGIITGVNPQVVIEDKLTQKTFYLNKGQLIGEMKVEDIQEGKVIINYKGQNYELYL